MTIEREWFKVTDGKGGCYHVQAGCEEEAVARAMSDGWLARGVVPEVSPIPCAGFGTSGVED